MKMLGYIAAAVAGLFVLMLIIGANVSDEQAAQWARENEADRICDQLMADSALGSERRMTRRMCEELKAKIAAEGKR